MFYNHGGNADGGRGTAAARATRRPLDAALKSHVYSVRAEPMHAIRVRDDHNAAAPSNAGRSGVCEYEANNTLERAVPDVSEADQVAVILKFERSAETVRVIRR